MVNERWITLLIFVGGIGVLWRTPALASIAAFGIVVIIVSLLLKRIVLKDVRYQRRLNETRVFIGEQVDVQCRITNEGRLPLLSLLARDDGPRSLIKATEGEEGTEKTEAARDDIVVLNQLVSLAPKSFASRAFSLQATRRGYFAFKPVGLNALDLLGLSETERVDDIRQGVLVYPRVFPLDALEVPPQQPLGDMVALRRFIEDPARNMGARDYVPGDPFRSIHWKATAHRGTLQTRVNEHTSDPTLMILLNVMTFPEDWYGVEVERFEWAVSVAASLAKWAHEGGATVGLSSNGCTPGRPEVLRVRPRRSPDQLVRVLESLAFISAFTLSRFLRFVLEEDVLPHVSLPRGVPAAISTGVHYVILLLGFVLAIGAAGIDLSRFGLLAGAFGVGIGFGLQNVVNNFVSGLILLFERPVQTGDTIEVGALVGEVQRIGIRSSTVRTFEGADVIVPNASLISERVVNWTFSDRQRRVDLNLGVTYGTDPERVIALLVAVGRAHPEVLGIPEPVALFAGFGESSLDFSLRVWTRFEIFPRVRSEIGIAVNTALRNAGIEIPFPQRDMNVKVTPATPGTGITG